MTAILTAQDLEKAKQLMADAARQQALVRAIRFADRDVDES